MEVGVGVVPAGDGYYLLLRHFINQTAKANPGPMPPVMAAFDLIIGLGKISTSAFGARYLVGTPRTMLRKVEAELLEENWKEVRECIEVKRIAAPDGSEDTFILCRSADHRIKEKAMHQRFEARMEEGLERMRAAIAAKRLQSRDVLHERLWTARASSATAWSFPCSWGMQTAACW